MARSPARFICYSLWLWFGVTQGRQVGKVGNSTPPGKHEDGLLSSGNLHLCIPHSNRGRPPKKNALFTLWTAGASIGRRVVEWCGIAVAAPTGPPKPGKNGRCTVRRGLTVGPGWTQAGFFGPPHHCPHRSRKACHLANEVRSVNGPQNAPDLWVPQHVIPQPVVLLGARFGKRPVAERQVAVCVQARRQAQGAS